MTDREQVLEAALTRGWTVKPVQSLRHLYGEHDTFWLVKQGRYITAQFDKQTGAMVNGFVFNQNFATWTALAAYMDGK